MRPSQTIRLTLADCFVSDPCVSIPLNLNKPAFWEDSLKMSNTYSENE